MTRNQEKICVECRHYGKHKTAPSFSQCDGVRDLVTGQPKALRASTARGDVKLCGPAGRYFEPAKAKVKERV